MLKRRASALTAALLGATLLLGGCGNDAADSSGPLKDVKVASSDPKKAPTVTVDPKPLSVTETTTRVVTPGSGAQVVEGDIVSVKFALLHGKDGKQLDQNYDKEDLSFDLGADGLLPGLRKGLLNQKVGSRLLVAVPPKDAFGDAGNPNLGVSGGDTIIFVMDVKSSAKPLKEAEGKAVAPKAGLPTVKFAAGKAATITMPKGKKPPKDTVAQTLVEGTGKPVAKGQRVRVTYTGALWKNAKVFDYSAKRAPGYFEFPVGQQQVIKAWDAKVEGAKVGSRLLLIVPPKDGYGASGSPQGGISGTDTLVFVIDVLAAY